MKRALRGPPTDHRQCHPAERAPGNDLSWLRRFAVTLLKRHPEKDSLSGKTVSCSLNTDFRTQVLPLKCVSCESMAPNVGN